MIKSMFTLALVVAGAVNVFGQASEKEFNKIKNKIFPIIKVETDGNDGANGTVVLTGDNALVHKAVAGDLLCFYGIDKGTHFELLPASKLPTTVTPDDLDALAKANLLKAVSKQLQMQTTGFNGYGFTCGGNHEAALILLPEIWEVLGGKLGDKIVFGVPSKDMAIYVQADKPDEIAGLKKMVDEIHSEGGKVLSKKLYVYAGGKIDVYQ